MSQNNSIAAETVRGSLYSVSASVVTLALGFIRSVLLARLLLPQHFGLLALALFFIGLAAQLRALGLDRALIHQRKMNDCTLGTYFTLRFGALLASLLLLFALSPILAYLYPTMPLLKPVLVALIGVEFLRGITIIQETLLRRRMAFRQLSMADVIGSVTMTIVAPFLAWRGWGIWALVAEQFSGVLARVISLWWMFPSWRPRLGWDKTIARWFWNYGRPTWVATNLAFLLDRFDDFWVGTALGKAALGYYSRSYEFARYPRRVISNPLVGVFLPTFAKVQENRLALSRAYFRAASVILRAGFLISGAFALIMPEFIHLIIGDKWMPMLFTFRLMLIYTLLDSLLLLSQNLLLAVGRPGPLARVRLFQVAFFIPAVIVGAYGWNINGVALAADGMLIVGAVCLCRYLREVVDFSLYRLGFWPLVALATAWITGWMVEQYRVTANIWLMAGLKLAVYTAIYILVLWLTERREYIRGVRLLWRLLRRDRSDSLRSSVSEDKL